LEVEVEPETAGSPTEETRWTRASLRSLSRRLTEAGHPIGRMTVRRLLRARHYSLRGHRKEKETTAAHPDRNRQFLYLRTQVAAFQAAGRPVISVDTKKKELIGEFKNAGRAWGREATEVNVHDFLQDAVGKAVPYGIYDLTRQVGTVFVGDSADTPEFAVEAIARWWETEGRDRYPTENRLLIVADAGGSNGCRPRAWKQQVQERLCDRWGLTVTVCHYPTGCSKYNPIEHRLFGPISGNWSGKVLRTFEHLLAYIRGTETRTGLRVRASRLEGTFEKGRTVSDGEMAALGLERHLVCPAWNYTFHPRASLPTPSHAPFPFPELVFGQ
jgi:hypothetical protein